MKYIFDIESDINPIIANKNEYIKKTIFIEAEDICEAILKIEAELSEEKVPGTYLPLTVRIRKKEEDHNG